MNKGCLGISNEHIDTTLGRGWADPAVPGYNVLIGEQAGLATQTTQTLSPGRSVGDFGAGAYNTVIGYQAAAGIGTADSGVVIGYQALQTPTSLPQSVVIIGYQAAQTAGQPMQSVIIGYEACNGPYSYEYSSTQSVLIGYQAGYNGASESVVIGYQAGQNGGWGNNVFVGSFAGYGANAQYSVAVGISAGYTMGSYSVAVGNSAGQGFGTYNISVGPQAGQNNTGGSCVFIGYTAGLNNRAAGNVAIGFGALGYSTSNTCSGLVCVGYETGLGLITNGNNNTFIGYQAGYTSTAANATTTGVGQTCLGYNTGQNTATQLSYITLLGYGAQAGASGVVAIGADHTGASATSSTQDEIALGTGIQTTHFYGGLKGTVASKTSTYAMNGYDFCVLANGTFTVTLPAPTAGAIYTVKNTGSGTITVSQHASEVIDGSSTISLSTQYESIVVTSDGTNWWIVASNASL